MIPISEQTVAVISEIARLKQLQKQGNLLTGRTHPDISIKRQTAALEAALQTLLGIESNQAVITQIKICAQRNRGNCRHCESIAKVLEEIE